MSLDNGIYILELNDQYRVAHRFAIENIYNSIQNMIDAFSGEDVIVCNNMRDATAEAVKLSDDVWAEHGIQTIYDFNHFGWNEWIKHEERRKKDIAAYHALLKTELRPLQPS